MAKADSDAPPRFSPKAAIAIIAVLLLLFACLAWFAVTSKSPTYDEPLHAVGAWQHLHLHDFRVNCEDPPLWHYWAALPNGPAALHCDTTSTLFAKVADDVNNQWQYVVETLYRTAGNDADAFITRSRFMMLLVGVALGVALACWSWQIGGAVAAVTAVIFFALDPNFIAHSPLVKNDISLSLIMLGLAWAIWRAGRRMTWWNAATVCLLCAAAVNVKFSGLLLGPIAAVMLITRALLPGEWRVVHLPFIARTRKLAAVAFLCFAALIVSYLCTWACYGFRFTPSPDPALQINMRRLIYYTAMNDMTARLGRDPTEAEVQQWKPTAVPRVVMRLNKWRALPQAWLAGFLYTYQSALSRRTYLLGEYSLTGWWYYFPLAMLYKSPLTLLLALAPAAAIAQRAFRNRTRSIAQASDIVWTTCCLVIPPAIYLLVAMRGNLNLGLRHVLPVYPFIYIALALALRYVFKHRAAIARIVMIVVTLALLSETATAFPDYIAFFNIAAGGKRNGINLLGDSNLDWGQDLKQLAVWQQEHPKAPLYLIYFGTADPWAYGIQYVNFPGGYKFGPVYEIRNDPGVLACSATMLQGIYSDPASRSIYSTLRKLQPFDVLGGTIYLYHWPPSEIPRE